MAAITLSELDEYILNKFYPVGSIYASFNGTNPSTLFGGVWEQIKDRFILAAGDSYTAGSLGGTSSVTLTVDQIPSHDHICKIFTNNNANYTMAFAGGIRLQDINGTSTWISEQGTTAGSSGGDTCGVSGTRGGSQSHENMPPYVVAYIWKRIS